MARFRGEGRPPKQRMKFVHELLLSSEPMLKPTNDDLAATPMKKREPQPSRTNRNKRKLLVEEEEEKKPKIKSLRIVIKGLYATESSRDEGTRRASQSKVIQEIPIPAESKKRRRESVGVVVVEPPQLPKTKSIKRRDRPSPVVISPPLFPSAGPNNEELLGPSTPISDFEIPGPIPDEVELMRNPISLDPQTFFEGYPYKDADNELEKAMDAST